MLESQTDKELVIVSSAVILQMRGWHKIKMKSGQLEQHFLSVSQDQK